MSGRLAQPHSVNERAVVGRRPRQRIWMIWGQTCRFSKPLKIEARRLKRWQRAQLSRCALYRRWLAALWLPEAACTRHEDWPSPVPVDEWTLAGCAASLAGGDLACQVAQPRSVNECGGGWPAAKATRLEGFWSKDVDFLNHSKLSAARARTRHNEPALIRGRHCLAAPNADSTTKLRSYTAGADEQGIAIAKKQQCNRPLACQSSL